jgi:hypothetical protein
VALLVGLSIEAEGLLAIGFVGNDGFGAALAQPVAQIGAVVSSIAEKLLGRPGAADQAFCRGAIMCLAAGQKDGKKTAFSICNCVDFRVAPAARAANCLLMFPLFAPEAERWALT